MAEIAMIVDPAPGKGKVNDVTSTQSDTGMQYETVRRHELGTDRTDLRADRLGRHFGQPVRFAGQQADVEQQQQATLSRGGGRVDGRVPTKSQARIIAP